MPDNIPEVSSEYPNWQAGNINKINNGYYGRAWYNPGSGDVIIAHRGSDELKDWAGPNVVLGGGQSFGWHSQFDSAHRFTNMVKQELHQQYPGQEFRMVHTGHSLGGAIAQVETARNWNSTDHGGHFKEEAYTFDNPGTKTLIQSRFGNDAADYLNRNSTEILAPENIVNTTGVHFDNVFRGEIPDLVKDYPELSFPSADYMDRKMQAGWNTMGKTASEYMNRQQGHRIDNLTKMIDPQTGMPYTRAEAEKLSPKQIDNILNGKNSSSPEDDDPLWQQLHDKGASSKSGEMASSGKVAPKEGALSGFQFGPILDQIAQNIQKLHQNINV